MYLHSDENRTEAVTRSKSNIFGLFKRLKSSTGDFWFIQIVREQCLSEGLLWVLSWYFVYATHTSKESSLNADIDAMIRNRLQLVFWPGPPFPRCLKMAIIFSPVVKVIWIFYFIKSLQSWNSHKIAFIVRYWYFIMPKFHCHCAKYALSR